MMKYYFVFWFFFSDQVCISNIPSNYLEHLPCPHDDSELRLEPICLAKISQIPSDSASTTMYTPVIVISFVKIWGCLSSIRPGSELMTRGVGWPNNYSKIVIMIRTIHCARFWSSRTTVEVIWAPKKPNSSQGIKKPAHLLDSGTIKKNNC